jgi:hypothetical protein
VTLFSPGGCGLLPKWRLLSHQLLKKGPEKTIKKIFKKKLSLTCGSDMKPEPQVFF